jgi:lipoprotein signal peptidase
MKNFFIRMFSSGGEVSSKRFSAFFTLFNIIILAYIATFMSEDKTTPEFMYDALALIAGGGLGLTVIEKIFAKKDNAPVNTDITEPIAPNCACGGDPSNCSSCKTKNK